MLPRLIFAVFAALALVSSSVTAAPDPTIIGDSTTAQAGPWHVVFREAIDSKSQKDWTGVYNATVEVYKDAQIKGSFKGSTLPNNKPTSTMPADWQYSVVSATCSLPATGKTLFYKWTRGKRADGVRPCLRLAKKVPTINVGSERESGAFLQRLIANTTSGSYLYATDILVHSGWSAESRGSAGCLTISPEDQKKFFDLIPEGANGTLELARGIHDTDTNTSHCY